MSGRPEPGRPEEAAALTPAAARAQIREIRGRLRPALLAGLARLYGALPRKPFERDRDGAGRVAEPGAAGDPVVDAPGARDLLAQIAAAEARLRELDRSYAPLLARVAAAEGALGWESFRPRLRGLRRCGADWAEAEVDLAFSPENDECVHGPSTAVPVWGLARKLLASRERVAGIERITWALPLRHRMRLSVWDAGQAGRPAPAAGGEETLAGRLRTSRGRALDFAGVALPAHPLLVQRDYNGLSRALVAGQRLTFGPAPESAALALSGPGLAAVRSAARRRPGLAAALLLDLVPLAILNWKRGRPMVACGYRDVPLPGPETAFAPGTRLELRYRAEASHVSTRSGLWIGYYQFRYAPRQEGWSTMVMAEADDPAAVLRQLHS